ncbi:hypothetical protein MNBD_ALPHA05-2208 [hydrothermal vent metagenome]|uniref:Uncharacterized protein n=1 Tax=hydrothermal vent metagenome TaxID=652676 RepID=A0A3B0T8V4_9ZZZZ
MVPIHLHSGNPGLQITERLLDHRDKPGEGNTYYAYFFLNQPLRQAPQNRTTPTRIDSSILQP